LGHELPRRLRFAASALLPKAATPSALNAAHVKAPCRRCVLSIAHAAAPLPAALINRGKFS